MGLLFRHLVVGWWIRLTTGRKCGLIGLRTNRDMAYLNECFEAGSLRPVIDGPYTLSQAPDAFRRFGAGMHQGKVVITM